MNKNEIQPKNAELLERFNKAVEKLKQDKAVMEEIRKRNLWQQLFSNNTKDLARAGISQSEVISEIHAIMQDMLEIISSNHKDSATIMSDLQEANRKQQVINSTLGNEIISEARKYLELSAKTKRLEAKVNNQEARLRSAEQRNKLLLDIKEISSKKNSPDIERLLMMCKCIGKDLADFPLSPEDKRAIFVELKKNYSQETISEDDLNSIQPKIAGCFVHYQDAAEHSTSRMGQFIYHEKPLHYKKEYAMSEIVSEIIDSVTVSEADRYIAFRDQLVHLLDEFVEKGIDVNGEHTPELCAIRKRLKESQFEIALIGEFQGGKSTTFNMLCGGREISPRGLNGGGIKTSAAVVTAQNIDGNETRNGLNEWAEITWLTPVEIKRRILYVVKKYDDESEPLCSPIIEDTPLDHISVLLHKAWDKNPREDELDLVRMATLQYRLLSSPGFDKIISQEIVPVDRFQEVVTFPQDWESRWLNRIDADFKPEECRFSIVDRVLVRIHSAELAKLGCRVTDCPGLFVSQWDTERAIEVMNNANAIWYLLSGQKQIGKNDLLALSKIRDYCWQDKCFFSINCRRGKEDMEPIAKSDMAALKNAEFYPEHIYLFDAFLAFRCAQAEMLANSTLPPKDHEYLAIESCRKGEDHKTVLAELGNKPENCLAAIRKMMVKHLTTIDEEDLADDLRNSETISSELQDALLIASGRPEILTAVESWIITRRARSILVTEGSQKCLNVLDHFKNNLLDQERAAVLTLQKAEKDAEEAKTKLDKFIQEWKENFEFLKEPSLDDGLAMDFFSENDSEIKSRIKSTAIEICKEEWHSSRHCDASDTNEASEERIKTEFIGLIKAKLYLYRKNITGKPKFKDSIGTPFSNKLERMKYHWEELQKETDLFQSLQIISEEEIGDLTFDSFDEKLDGSIDLPWYSWEFLKDLFTLGIRRLFQTPDERIEKFFIEKDPVGHAYDAFKGDNANEKKIANALGAQRRHYVSALEKSFDKLKSGLEQIISDTMDIVKRNNAERERIAAEAKDKRENIVQPYARMIQQFQEEVSRFYAE